MQDSFPISSLPDEPSALKQIIVQLTRRCEEAQAKFENAQAKFEDAQVKALHLELRLMQMLKRYYGPKADRLGSSGDVAQMLLEFAREFESRPINPQDLPAGEQETTEPAPRRVKRISKGRRNLAAFDHLPLQRREYDLSEQERICICCGKIKPRIGQESSFQIEYIPGHFERIEHVRFKYGCVNCENEALNPQIILAPKPLQPIDKGMAGPGLLAYVITSKYADYLPLYRIANIFQRNGLEISRATQSIWCGDVADLLQPLYKLMTQRILQSHLICTDDTIQPMLAPGKTRQCRIWVYIGDEDNPYNIFDFTLGRGRDGPLGFLAGYNQTLLADAYGGYDGVVVGNDITRAGCWAHGRRKFIDVEKSQPAIAAEAVKLIGGLYAIEKKAASVDIPTRLEMRQRESLPILALINDKLHYWKQQLLPKHPMAKAVGYHLNQWQELTAYAADGAVPIDNNISEREMKRVVLNRKNSLFVGNERGGRTAAILSSFTSTCIRHKIDPQRYLTQLLTNLPSTPMRQLHQWLPDDWKRSQARPEG